jgi:hypothetical protein
VEEAVVEVAVMVVKIPSVDFTKVEASRPPLTMVLRSSVVVPAALTRRLPAMERVVPESKVKVPEVKLSEVSLLRKEPESIESKVVASVQLLVTLTVKVPPNEVEPEPVVQVPFPAVKVELTRAALVMTVLGSVTPPAVTVKPLLEASPPPPTKIPPVKVLVALTVETMVPPAMVTPPFETLRSLTRRPPVKVLVALLVWFREPPERVMPLLEERPAEEIPPEKVDEPVWVEVMVPEV